MVQSKGLRTKPVGWSTKGGRSLYASPYLCNRL